MKRLLVNLALSLVVSVAFLGALEGPSEQDNGLSEADFRRPSLAESEWNHIQQVLADCEGNVTHAARILDIPRRTLQRKLKKRAP